MNGAFRRRSKRKRWMAIRPAGLVPVACAIGVLIGQATILIFTSPGFRAGVSALLTLATFVIAAVVIKATRWRRPTRDGGMRAAVAAPGAPDPPSPKIALAYHLARRGVPAAHIANRCDLPIALADLIVADALAADPSRPRKEA